MKDEQGMTNSEWRIQNSETGARKLFAILHSLLSPALKFPHSAFRIHHFAFASRRR